MRKLIGMLVEEQVHRELRELAWQRKTTMSDLLRPVLQTCIALLRVQDTRDVTLAVMETDAASQFSAAVEAAGLDPIASLSQAAREWVERRCAIDGQPDDTRARAEGPGLPGSAY